MDRRRGSGLATLFVDETPAVGALVLLSESAAQHVHVRRLAEGDEVRLVDGAGTAAYGRLHIAGKRHATVSVSATERVARPAPLTLLVPVADRDRMLWLAEKAAECAVSVWQPVMFERSRGVSPRGEGEGFDRKVHARMIAALEQSGGGWLPEVRPIESLEGAVQGASDLSRRLVLHAEGAPFTSFLPFGDAAVAVGPEGGITAAELDLLLAAGWRTASLGGTTLRFETAGIAAAAIVRASQGP